MRLKNKNKSIDDKKQLNKWIKIGVPILIVVLFVLVPLLISQLSGIGMGSGTGGAITQVEVMEVMPEDITEEITITGTVSSDNTKSYYSPVNATVEACEVKVGQVVKAGDVLISFDQEELENNNLQSEFTYKQSVSEYNVAIANDAELKSEVATATSKVASIEKSISSAESSISGIQSKLTSLGAQQSAKQEEIDALKAEIESANQQSESADVTTTVETTVDVDTLQQKLETAESELATINSKITTYTTSMETKVQELSELEIELAQNEAIVESGSAGLTSEQLEVLAMSNNLAELAELEADELLELGKQGIIAEFDGVISAVTVTEGMQVSQGMELITIASNEEVSVDVEISVDEFDSVHVGNPVEIKINDYEYEGEVNEVSQIATVNATGTNVINARIKILDSDDNMFLGVNAKNTIITESKTGVLCVPSSTINTSTDGEFVYVLVDGVVEKRMIELGITALDKIEVVSGLEEGDLVITDMVAVLSEGMLAEAKTE